MSSQAKDRGGASNKFVLRRVAIRSSFQGSFAPFGVVDFINSTPYPHKSLLLNTMSGLFDVQIPVQRPEWWIVTQDNNIKGLALISYCQLNFEGPKEFVGVEHLIVAPLHRNKGVGTLILKTLQKLVRKSKNGLGGVNLEAEEELVPFYARFGFVRRKFQSGAFTKLLWKLS